MRECGGVDEVRWSKRGCVGVPGSVRKCVEV